MATEFEPGALVTLKSGGPLMTVESFHNDSGKYFCEWFADKERKSELFNGATLELYQETTIETW